jgi:hypothetical protein
MLTGNQNNNIQFASRNPTDTRWTNHCGFGGRPGSFGRRAYEGRASEENPGLSAVLVVVLYVVLLFAKELL